MVWLRNSSGQETGLRESLGFSETGFLERVLKFKTHVA